MWSSWPRIDCTVKPPSDLTPSVLYEEQRRHGVIEREKTVVCLYTIQIKLTGCCESERIDLRY